MTSHSTPAQTPGQSAQTHFGSAAAGVEFSTPLLAWLVTARGPDGATLGRSVVYSSQAAAAADGMLYGLRRPPSRGGLGARAAIRDITAAPARVDAAGMVVLGAEAVGPAETFRVSPGGWTLEPARDQEREREPRRAD